MIGSRRHFGEFSMNEIMTVTWQDLQRSSDDYSLNNGTQSLESDWTFLCVLLLLLQKCKLKFFFFFAPHSSDTITCGPFLDTLCFSALTVASTTYSWTIGHTDQFASEPALQTIL